MSEILKYTIEHLLKKGIISRKDLKKTVVDTTVMEKRIAHPTDTKLLNKSRENLVKLAKKENIQLRQTYKVLAKRVVLQASRCVVARRFKKIKSYVRKLKTYLGRVVRDIQRKISKADSSLRAKFEEHIVIALKLLEQEKNSKEKIYSIHEPKVYCVSKGKIRKAYEYGSKVSIVMTQNKGIVINTVALEKNQYDGHTLKSSLEGAEKLSGQVIKEVLVDRGYRKHGITDKKIYISGQKKELSNYRKRKLRKRSAIKAYISHMKNSSKLALNYLKKIIGDKVNALLCAIGHNLRVLINNYLIILKFRKASFLYFLLPSFLHRMNSAGSTIYISKKPAG